MLLEMNEDRFSRVRVHSRITKNDPSSFLGKDLKAEVSLNFK